LDRPHIDQGDRSGLEAAHELSAIDRLEIVAADHVVTDDSIQLGEPRFHGAAQREPELLDGVICDPVEDARAFPTRIDEPRPCENLEMLRSVGDRESGRASQSIYGALALQEKIEQLKPSGSGERLGDPRELLVDALLGGVGWYGIGHSIHSLNTQNRRRRQGRSGGAPGRAAPNAHRESNLGGAAESW